MPLGATLDIELNSDGWLTEKERAAREKRVKKNEILILPVARVVLPHYPHAEPVRPINTTPRLVFPPTQRLKNKGGRVIARAIVVVGGRMDAIWFAESTDRGFEASVSDFLLRPTAIYSDFDRSAATDMSPELLVRAEHATGASPVT